MGQKPTMEPLRRRDDSADQPAPDRAENTLRMVEAADAEDRVDAGSQDREPPGAGSPESTAAASAEPSIASAAVPSASVACALTGERAAFLEILCAAAEAEISPAIRRSFRRAGNPGAGETAAFERLIDVVVDEAEPPDAALICAALAARTVARSLPRAEAGVGEADGEALIAAWLETARAIAAARGAAGLRRLLPTAGLLARKSAGRGEPAAEIATTMRRIAARIVAELSLDRAFGGAAQDEEYQPMPSGKSSPRRIVIRGPVEMTLDAR
jgi:hypothetical protein